MSTYSYDRTASSKVTPELQKQIKKLTDANRHNEALALKAKVIGATSLQKRFDLLEKLTSLEGGIPKELREYRDYLSDELKRFAKQELSNEDFELFW